MRFGIPLAVSFLLLCDMALVAQEQIPLPQPDPVPTGALGQPTSPQQPGQFTPPGTITPPPPGNYPFPGGYPYPPYPGPGIYAPPPPPIYTPLLRGDPATNPTMWLGVEALVWWSKSQPLPVPVITTGPASQGNNPGGLGVPGTVSLDSPLNFGAQGGVRLFGGGWFDQAHTWGLDGSVIVLGQQNASFGASDRTGTGNFVINEPVAGAPFSTLVSAPGIDTGNVGVNSSTEFWGLDLNVMYNLFRNSNWSLTLLAGFRYLQLDENITITANSSLFTTTTYTDNLGNVLATAPPGSTVTVVDEFGTHNQFYGGQVGARFQANWNRWSFEGTGFLAIGATHESVNVNGYTVVYPVNANPVPLVGGN